MKLPVNYNNISIKQKKIIREYYINIQNGLCHFCKQPLNDSPTKNNKYIINKKLFPKGFFDWPVHLHHDHNTGMTIGAVHCQCNAILWQYYGK